jgi:hypothetical protein
MNSEVFISILKQATDLDILHLQQTFLIVSKSPTNMPVRTPASHRAIPTLTLCTIQPQPPAYVRNTFWVCCQCGWLSNAATSVQCVNCQHGFCGTQCTKETHESPAGR